MSKTQLMRCPHCKAVTEIDIGWAIRNGRVSCLECCRSFDIRVGEEEEEKKETPPPVPKKEEPKKEDKKPSREFYNNWDEF